MPIKSNPVKKSDLPAHALQSFILRVSPLESCWEWKGCKNKAGYGIMAYSHTEQVLAHRASYALFRGDVPRDSLVMHLCDNPACVNPDHLSIGDHDENVRQCADRGRARNQYTGATHCDKGHEYTEENTYYKRSGGRNCRACNRESQSRYAARQRRAAEAKAER